MLLILAIGVGLQGTPAYASAVDIPLKDQPIIIQYDKSKDSSQLTILHGKVELSTAPQSYGYELDKGKKVILSYIDIGRAKTVPTLQIAYSVIGGEDEDEQLRKAVQETFSSKDVGEDNSVSLLGELIKERKIQKQLQVTDGLKSGSTLMVEFRKTVVITKTTTNPATATTTLDTTTTADTLYFSVKRTFPRVFVTTGFIFSNSSDQEVVIEKTNTLDSFVVDGEQQFGYRQRLTMEGKRDAELSEIRPISVLYSFLNVSIIDNLCGTLGLPVGKIDEFEPVLGLSWFNPVGKSTGWEFTAGVHFYKDTEFKKGTTAFKENQEILRVPALTLEDVPTEEIWKRAFFVSLSFKIQ
jgi:hypothetical protein